MRGFEHSWRESPVDVVVKDCSLTWLLYTIFILKSKALRSHGCGCLRIGSF